MVEQTLGRSVLIVDDHAAVLELFRTALTSAGIGVHTAPSGTEAIRVLHALRHSQLPDLILLDIMMPGIDGFETLRRIKSSSLTRKIPVVMLTVSSKKDDVLQARDLGAADYILKHAAMGRAMDKIHKHLGRTLPTEIAPFTADSVAVYDPGMSIAEAEIRQSAAERSPALVEDVHAPTARASLPSPEELKSAMAYLDEPGRDIEEPTPPPLRLDLAVDRSGPAIYFQIKGDLAPETLPDLIAEIDKHLATRSRRVVFDLSLARRIEEPARMECLGRALERARNHESHIRLVSYDDRIYEFLKSEELTRRLPLFNSKVEALMSFR